MIKSTYNFVVFIGLLVWALLVGFGVIETPSYLLLSTVAIGAFALSFGNAATKDK